MMTIRNQFELGEIVYLKTDLDQHPRQIISITVSIDGGMFYKCVAGLETDIHFEAELSREKDMALKTGSY